MNAITTAPNPAHRSISRQRIAELRVLCQKDPSAVAIHREAITELLAADLPAEALPLLRRLASLVPDDANVHRQLAIVSAQLDQHTDAIAAWRNVRRITGDTEDTLHNLGVAACAAGDYQTACEAFERKLEAKPACYETLNDLAVLHALLGRPDDSARCYIRCLEINPRYEKGRDNAFTFFWEQGRLEEGSKLADTLADVVGRDREIEEWRARFRHATPELSQADAVHTADGLPRVKNRRIAFIASSDAFLKPIIDQLRRHNHVRVFSGGTREELADFLCWAELVWLEWCDGLAIEASRLPKTAKIVCRLHSYEAFTDAPRQMNWANIDHLILVSDTVGEILRESHKPAVPTTIIHNGVDPDRFPFIERPTRGKRIGSVGYINYKKNPSLLLQTFKAIHDRDPEFELHIAGEHQDPRIKVYFDHLLPRLGIPVTFHGWIADMPGFYRDMDYVISTSLFESFHYSIAEGMLSGCLPLIHSWRGADQLYPADCLFDTPSGAVDLIERYRQMDDARLARSHRDYIIERYNWPDRHEEIDALLDSVLRGAGERPGVRTVRRMRFEPKPKSDFDGGMVSIIIPAHNNAACLPETTDSALGQTYRNMEVIVCDDGSTDNTTDVLSKYGDRITAIRQTRRGLPAALNAAIQSANGRFIAPLLPGDILAPDKIETQVRMFVERPGTQAVACLPIESDRLNAAPSFDNVLKSLRGRETARPISPSLVLIDRDVLDQTGWFEEMFEQTDGLGGAWGVLWERLTHLADPECVDLPLVDVLPDAPSLPAESAATRQTEVIHTRWRDVTTGAVTRVQSAQSRRAGIGRQTSIVIVAAQDADGQLAAWADTLTRFTGHKTRLLTHTVPKGRPGDLTLCRPGPGDSNSPRRSLRDILAEAESAVHEAGLILFAAGLGPGALRSDVRVEDTDEQPFGTLDWAEHAKGKMKAAILWGTPSVRANLIWYRDRAASKGWPILTCEPDIHRWLPEAHYLPRVIPPINDAAVKPRPDSPMAIVYPGGLEAHEGAWIIRETAAALKESHPDVMFGRCQDMTPAQVFEMKAKAHIGIDRIAVGTGSFSIESLENSALGLINIVWADPYAITLIARTIGAGTCPWERIATPARLLEVLRHYAADPSLRRAKMQETRQWFEKYWNAQRMAQVMADVLERL